MVGVSTFRRRELSHAKVRGELTPGQDWKQEIVAELSASALCQLVGKKGAGYLGNSYRYNDRYAQKANLSPLKACLQVMADVEKVLQKILGGDGVGNSRDFFDDLSEAKQQQLLELYQVEKPEQMNWDVIPIFVIEEPKLEGVK